MTTDSLNPAKNTLCKLKVFLCVLTVFYFSFIPLYYYVVELIGIDKKTLFILLITISFALVLFKLLSTQTVNRDKMQVFGLYLIFAIYALISFWRSEEPQQNIQTIVVLSVINPLFLCLSLSCSKNKHLVCRYMYVLSFVYFVIVAYQLLFGRGPDSVGGFNKIFSGVDGYAYQNISLYLGLFVVLSTTQLWSARFVKRLFSLITILVACYLMLIVGGRSAMVSAILASTIFLLTEKTPYFTKSVSSMVSIVGVSVLGISFLIYINNTSITLLGINRFYELLATGDSSMRLFLFSESIKLYTLSYENLIFGSGLGNFQTYIGMPGIGMYPHNLFLELLAECGSIGFVLFIIPIVYLFKLRKMRLGSMVGKHRLERMVFFVFLYFCIITSFSGGFETSFLFVFIIYLLFVDKDIPRQAKKEVVREIRTVS